MGRTLVSAAAIGTTPGRRGARVRRSSWTVGLGTLSLLIGTALGSTVSTFSPQGEVAHVRQVRAVFSEPMVALGDPRAPSPFVIECPEAGSGRWVDTRTWTFDYLRDVPPGVRCRFTLDPGLRSLSGTAVTGKPAYTFRTGGPAIVRAQPAAGSSEIDERQVFVLTLNGPAAPASMAGNTWCEVEGIGERLPAVALGDPERDVLLQRLRLQAEAARMVVLQCQRRLPQGAKVSVVWGRGIATASGVATTRIQRLDYTVRRAFEASVNCEREHAHAPCVPLRPIALEFSAPVPRALANGVRLRVLDQALPAKWWAGREENSVSRIEFAPPFPESTEAVIELPPDFRDDAGRTLANAGSFPLRVRIGAAPPLVKFPAPFGIVEARGDATLPVTVRRVDRALAVAMVGALPLASLRADGDAEVIGWLQRLHARGFDFERQEECQDGSDGTPVRPRKQEPPSSRDCRQAREVSLLAGHARAQRRQLPLPDEGRPLTVVGIPFERPGFYVVEVESPALGTALLGRSAALYVRTSVLVTNLAVHFKRGNANALAWVTALDTGKPVADAEVRVSDCTGQELWRGRTDRDGLAKLPGAPTPRGTCQPRGPDRWQEPALFVSARAGGDYGFVLSNWNAGIERWRFGVPTANGGTPVLRAHTVFDRTLLRAGDTISMQHYIRRETPSGLAQAAPDVLPDQVRIRHSGSGQEFAQPLTWRHGTAQTQHTLPREARLGEYEVILQRAPERSSGAPRAGVDAGDANDPPAPPELRSGQFRVAEFRLPVMHGKLAAPAAVQVAVSEVPFAVQLGYVNGGPAAGVDLMVSSVLRPREVVFPGYEGYRFARTDPRDEGQDEGEPRERLVADRIPVKLDRNGAGRATIGGLPALVTPQLLRTEATYLDPNGERQTLAASTPLWPAAVLVGIRADDWVSAGRKVGVTLVVLDTEGKPVPKVPVEVRGEARTSISHRKRLLGGFYAYEHHTERKPLGTLCAGKSDARGLLFCDVALTTPGNVILTATARDSQGRQAQADTALWVTEQGDVWFETESQDRMDVLPERRRYQPGETARFQLRMPFRAATVLVGVEREGMLETLVREVSGRNPTIEVPIKASHGPNVYVSALAVRGRLREVPWYSAFVWGWRAPVEWWYAWREWREKGTPGATVDLAKPAFKYGLAEVQVGLAPHELKVSVEPAREAYRIREKAAVRVRVQLPDGRPAPAGTEVAFAAVDMALLELEPNRSWDLLEAMYRRRAYAVETATAQMQVIGRRHYGRKAVASGGGGGRAPLRELFDTLLLWEPKVRLDAQGEARLEVPLNDALTRFALVAIAAVGDGDFGTGAATVRVVQDLQVVSGLPPVVRAGDRYRATFTVRNTTSQPLRVRLQASAEGAALEPQTVDLPAREAREAGWQVSVPPDGGASVVRWEVLARDDAGAASDALRVVQQRVLLNPVTVHQASLVQIKGALALPWVAVPGALPGSARLDIALRPKLGVVGPGVRRYFENYPFVCLEQKVSRAIGLRDRTRWQAVVEQLPAYVDDDGLVRYFPGEQPGSDTLTAYLLAVAHESGFALPSVLTERLLGGLAAFVDGRIQRQFWSPRADLAERKLAAIEALARYGRAAPRHLESIAIEPGAWPTGAVVDWRSILARMPGIPDRDSALARADQILRSRLDFTGARLQFALEADDHRWWLLSNAEVSAARLMLAVLAAPTWREQLPALATGLVGRQVRGHWQTTTANVWGSLALEKFGEAVEKTGVTGRTGAWLADAPRDRAEFDWASAPNGGALSLARAAPRATLPTAVRLEHTGDGAPWATLQSLAAVPLAAPQAAGYRIERSATPVEQKVPGKYSRGDIIRVRVEFEARSDMTWVVVSDPVPAGGSILGTGLQRDSEIATRGERRENQAIPAFEERAMDVFRAYYEYVPKGKWSLEYTLRLNSEGVFGLPPTRVEAMYAPEMFGEHPNPTLVVQP